MSIQGRSGQWLVKVTNHLVIVNFQINNHTNRIIVGNISEKISQISILGHSKILSIKAGRL